MGLAKSYYMEQQEQDHWEIDSKKICRKCLEDGTDFTLYFKTNSSKAKCDYCQKSKKTVEINELISFISEKVFAVYTNPVHVLPYESAEGGYHGAKLRDIESILEKHIAFSEDDSKQDILSAFDGAERYCETDPFSDKEGDIFKGYWDKFVRIVKYEMRFFFPRPPKARVSSIKLGGLEDAGDILNFSFNEMKRQKLFRTLSAGETIFRAREIDPSTKNPNDPNEYMLPSLDISSKRSNRLSPAGIPIFYGAFDKEHLVSEIRAANTKHIYIAEFKINKSITVLDLTKFDHPSIFKDDGVSYEGKRFIRSFINDIMTPVTHDGREHLEYVPSQVFSEFIRHRVKHHGKNVAGIIFPSSFDGSSRNIALYINNADIELKGPTPREDKTLILKRIFPFDP